MSNREGINGGAVDGGAGSRVTSIRSTRLTFLNCGRGKALGNRLNGSYSGSTFALIGFLVRGEACPRILFSLYYCIGCFHFCSSGTRPFSFASFWRRRRGAERFEFLGGRGGVGWVFELRVDRVLLRLGGLDG